MVLGSLHLDISAVLGIYFASLLVPAWCWGNVGHRTVAYLATKYLDEADLALMQAATGYDELSDAAVWADEVAHLPAYEYSRSWHYINVQDHPPVHCGINLTRDHQAQSGDIITAFVNHTALVRSSSACADEKREAMRFLLHWIGDVHQPLHAEGLARGGVDLSVVFAGLHTNLHFVWDVAMIDKYRGEGHEKEVSRTWANEIYARDRDPHLITNRECDQISSPMHCILAWAKQSNKAVCEIVFKENVTDHDLSLDYYEENISFLEIMVTLAGRRLGAWMKAIAADAVENSTALAPRPTAVKIVMTPDDNVDYFAEQGQLEEIAGTYALQNARVGQKSVKRTAYCKGETLVDFPRCLNGLCDTNEPAYQALVFRRFLEARPYFRRIEGRDAPAQVLTWGEFVQVSAGS
ncbi:hypothetical protein LTR35_014163 [Friedmanniomyces endolithicus]|uniref:Uncharacterized protein n=1 Tax=Friedmanniomyces endolithicus TaxID=329885 RepID=A0AAN6J579_9PEZI|nr:hypothetical protein LTR35_014163 [Friedmanniomyces endolithicus]KAK0278275.1 hypothetical protein LTS00_013887 [Friedmanniomyces endolithicus]KAK0316927.1 hypothetical protein LTR82_012069 [Friedmanniomyces endolithicus]KAK0982439.1 hypothetical protein LTR54_014669 [Friedmanniomyces endolithicus]